MTAPAMLSFLRDPTSDEPFDSTSASWVSGPSMPRIEHAGLSIRRAPRDEGLRALERTYGDPSREWSAGISGGVRFLHCEAASVLLSGASRQRTHNPTDLLARTVSFWRALLTSHDTVTLQVSSVSPATRTLPWVELVSWPRYEGESGTGLENPFIVDGPSQFVYRPASRASSTSLFFSGAWPAISIESGETAEADDSAEVGHLLLLLQQLRADEVDDDAGPSETVEELTEWIRTGGERRLRVASQALDLHPSPPRDALWALVRCIGRAANLPRSSRRVWLESALKDRRPSMRDAAADALVELNDPAAVEALRKAAEIEAHPVVRRNLLSAVGDLGG